MRLHASVTYALAAALVLSGCATGSPNASSQGQDPSESSTQSTSTIGQKTAGSYTQISQDEAKEMMGRSDGHVVVDVRRQDEYDAGHIPGAVLIPNESIEANRPEKLPDLNQVILIYCRSGNRSKQAAQKLADMGYANVYEFGGIITWTGEVVTE